MRKETLLFGPVKSRRLGRSLGIEMVPKKVCTMDCIYCEVGKTTTLTRERKAYYSWDLIEKSILKAKEKEGNFDVFTFTGSGEPTLNIHFEEAVKLAKKVINKPVTVLTNSTLIEIDSIKEALKKVDIVLPSLDAAKEETFRKINRPLKDFTPEIIITNLKELREGMEGEMWLEVLIVEGINDSEEDLKALKSAIEEINPHKVQLNTVVRPGAYRIARPVSFEKLKKIADFLGEKTEIVVNKERLDKIIAKRLTLEREKLVEEILSYVKRRPATFKELMDAFLIDEKSLEMILAELVSENKIKIKKHQGEDYYIAD